MVFSVYGRDCNGHLDIVLLVRSCCSQTDECSLYLECRLLAMRTGAPDSGPDLHRGVRGEYPAAEIDYRYRGLRGRTSRKSSVGPRVPNRADVYVRSDTVLYEMRNMLSRAHGIEDRTCR